MKVLKNGDGNITGINLVAQESTDTSKGAFCKGTTRWSVSFDVMCSESETGALSYDKISFAKNSDRCTLEFKVYHNSGCGVVKASGLIQYLSSKPWLISLILLAVGFVICFFGGKLIKLVYIALPSLLAFLFLANMLSSFGAFSVLEEDNETTWKGGA